LIAAVFYFLLATHVITVPSLNAEDAPRGIVYMAGGCYLLGGLLILLEETLAVDFRPCDEHPRDRIFLHDVRTESEVIFSLPGLGTKIPQILLEAGLLYLLSLLESSRSCHKSSVVTAILCPQVTL
jgi:hypothetical protein